MSVERENAVINNTIILRNNFRYSQTNDYFDPSAISKVEILDSDGVAVLETISGASIVKDSTGKYYVVASAITTAKTIYDKWTFTPSSGAVAITKTNTCVVWATSAGSGAGLTTLSKLREFLKKDTADTADDTLLTNLIARLSAEVEKRCNRIFSLGNYTEYYSGNGSNKQYVKNWPVNSVASIHVDDDRVWGSDTQIDAADIIISNRNPGMIILDGGNTFLKTLFEIENVRIIYNGGYSTIPEDLEQRIMEICSARYMKSSGLINTSMKDKIDPDEMEKSAWEHIENNYRAIPV